MDGVGTSYGTIAKDIKKQIGKGGLYNTPDFDYDQNKQLKDEILASLQEQYGYKGTRINNEMKMDTTISIVSMEGKNSYTIRVRKRN